MATSVEIFVQTQTLLFLRTRNRNDPSVNSSVLELQQTRAAFLRKAGQRPGVSSDVYCLSTGDELRLPLGEGGDRRKNKVHMGEAGTGTAEKR